MPAMSSDSINIRICVILIFLQNIWSRYKRQLCMIPESMQNMEILF